MRVSLFSHQNILKNAVVGMSHFCYYKQNRIFALENKSQAKSKVIRGIESDLAMELLIRNQLVKLTRHNMRYIYQ
jgi:hypothetical protein